METESKYGYECSRDVRISRLEVAFEQSQLRLRQLQQLPELSAILPTCSQHAYENTRSTKMAKLTSNRKRCNSTPPNSNNKVSCHLDDTSAADKTSETVLADDIKIEEAKQTVVPPIRIARVQSLSHQAIPKRPHIVHSATPGGFNCNLGTATPLSRRAYPWYSTAYYQQYPYYHYAATVPQLNPYVYSAPRVAQGLSQAYSDSPYQITRGQIWFPPDTPEQLQGIAGCQQSRSNWPSQQPVIPAHKENWTTCRYYTDCGTGAFLPLDYSQKLSARESHTEPHIHRSEISKSVRIATF